MELGLVFALLDRSGEKIYNFTKRYIYGYKSGVWNSTTKNLENKNAKFHTTNVLKNKIQP